MTGTSGVVLWLVLAILFIVVEGITVQLVSLWFVIGTIPAMIAAGLGANGFVQGLLFLITSIVVLLLFRPMLRKRLTPEAKPTNADRVIGMTGVVEEGIDNLQETGRVMANGLMWTARSAQDTVKIPVKSQVTVLDIEGVKLIVEPKDTERTVPQHEEE